MPTKAMHNSIVSADDGKMPQPGDILLFQRATGLNRFITWFTRSPYYHVAIYAGDNCVIEARPKGVVRRDLRSREGGHHFVVIPAPRGKGREALRWAESKLGERYDRTDVAIIIFERIFRHLHINHTPRDKFACGEFVATAFQEVGAPLIPDCAPADTVPGDFARLLASDSSAAALSSEQPGQEQPRSPSTENSKV